MNAVPRSALVIAILSAGIVGLLPSAARAERTLTLSVLTAVPQVKGELTLTGTVGGDGSDASVSIEHYLSRRWVEVGSESTADDGSFIHTRVLDASGAKYFRATIPANGSEPATVSPNVRIYVYPEPAPDKRFDTTSIPTVFGDEKVGITLRAEPGQWSPSPDYFTYRWNRNGVSTGKTGRTYALTGADVGAYVTVTVGGWRSGAWTMRDSRPTKRIERGSFTTAPPEIVGRAVVGESVSAVITGWNPTPTSVSYRWLRDGATVADATSDSYTLTTEDVGMSLSVTVHAEAEGVEPVDVTSAAFPVPAGATNTQRTFGDLIEPLSTQAWGAQDLSYIAGAAAPPWGPLSRTRWDAPGAYTHAQTARPAGTLASAMFSAPLTRPEAGAEYPGTNPSLKNADVTFDITASRFAIAYRGNPKSEAMVWIDSRPIAGSPILGTGPTDKTTANWISVTLPERRKVSVRFAGPYTFTGVDTPTAEAAVITAAVPHFTLGVLSDSFFDACSDTAPCQSRNAAPTLGTLTGFRVWNMSESATGYVNPGNYSVPGYEPSPYGSSKRLGGIKDAPLDALLIGGSMNDALMSLDLHRPAVDRLLSDLEATRPDLPVVLVGIEPITGGFKSSYWISRGTLLTSNLQAMVGRHQNVVGFIDPFTDPWLTGTGSVANPKGDGNNDQYVGPDGTHLNAAGTAYYQQRVVDGLRPLPLPQPD